VKIRVGSQHQDIVEINGKKYNAITGHVIAEVESKETPVKQPINFKKTGVIVDGIVRAKARTSTRTNPIHAHKPIQKSHTLMRNVVKKPAPTAKVASNSHTSTLISKATLSPSRHMVQAAQSIPKNPLISKFGEDISRSSVIKKTGHLPVKQPQVHEHQTLPENVHHQAKSLTPVTDNHTNNTRSRATTALIEKALSSASSHEQPKHSHKTTKRRHRIARRMGVSSRAMAVSSSVLAGVLLGGFFAVQNVPNLSMRVAAARAGFAASMPSYKPSGFSFKGPINYSAGIVTVSFKSNTDDRSYSVTQRSSNWNSDALLSNYVVAENKQYQTYIDRGRTLYIYDGSNATWVDNGVWYQVEGPSDMTTDQLVRIAASI
jgi:hypothetical protein